MPNPQEVSLQIHFLLSSDDIRQELWHQLLEIDLSKHCENSNKNDLLSHSEYSQVVLDVNRSLKRFPPGIPIEQRLALQDQLTLLILKVIHAYPRLRYYQGYHDVAITFLLVVGEMKAFRILEVLSNDHLSENMRDTMDETSYVLNYMYPLVNKRSQELCEFLERSCVGTMFCLPWYLTWFSHNLNRYSDVVRLYDYFLASPKLLPIYLISVIVLYREQDILQTSCEMPSVHCLLAQLPEDLPYETLLQDALEMYEEFPPDQIKQEVDERVMREAEKRKKELEDIALRRKQLEKRKQEERERDERAANSLRTRLFYWVPAWVVPTTGFGLVFWTTSIAVGIYAMLKMSEPNSSLAPLYQRLVHLWTQWFAWQSNLFRLMINNTDTDVLEGVVNVIGSVVSNNTTKED
uniref:TBC1 domain family member 20 n=1 Tax=Cacopsylla melanoneura TaxID=428564 RepID=A0A8D8SGE8_9HEMI